MQQGIVRAVTEYNVSHFLKMNVFPNHESKYVHPPVHPMFCLQEQDRETVRDDAIRPSA